MTESKTPLTSEKMSEPTPEVSSTSKATLKQTTQKNDTKAVGAKPSKYKTKTTKQIAQ
ncbi:hypothetical protein L3081_01255 [Colwellia sp. MSW7]|uniref:Uncharacterized protein n=1 Tax=Colwellia maritima TaxID=2912588 RepID=A0ABS9WYK4_9GAMM|nr:hypothetical protein [Colwellia maritima]MCI2282281.1 hypothetical protein [Colwellia maritima]